MSERVDHGGTAARVSEAEATLSAYSPFTQQTLVPVLLYKSLFLGDWFNQMVRHAADDSTRRALANMSRETLRETIELLLAMRDWDAGQADPEVKGAFVEDLHQRVLQDLLRVKEGNNEVLVLVAMRAPTEALREKLLRLADLDRAHADEIRTLLGVNSVLTSLDRAGRAERGRDVGAHSGRVLRGTLGESILHHIAAIREQGDQPERVVLSHVALRHLRDEGHVSDEGLALGLPVDVDFGWEGECYSIVTSSRVRLAEILTLREGPKDEAKPDEPGGAASRRVQ